MRQCVTVRVSRNIEYSQGFCDNDTGKETGNPAKGYPVIWIRDVKWGYAIGHIRGTLDITKSGIVLFKGSRGKAIGCGGVSSYL